MEIKAPDKVYKSPDYTFYLPAEDLKKQFGDGKDAAKSLDTQAVIVYDKDQPLTLPARALICLCEERRTVSVTLRGVKPLNGVEPKRMERPKQFGKKEGFPLPTGYGEGKEKFLASTLEICKILKSMIMPDDAQASTGLVVFAASTNSAKSVTLRGLVRLYLEQQVKNGEGRRPHLLLIGEPVEKSWNAPKDDDSAVDCTARTLGKDVDNLGSALLRDALRQTPAAVLVEETRNKEDWKTLVEFAGTGHLVFTTAHAGSLTEAVDRILRACEANSPAERGQVMNRIRAVVHLEKTTIDKFPDFSLLMMSVWRRTPDGVRKMVSDGLSSLLPAGPRSPGETESCLGYGWMAHKLKHDEVTGDDNVAKEVKAIRESEWTAIEHRAMAMDICGGE